MADNAKYKGWSGIIDAVKSELGFFALVVLAVEVILGILAGKAEGGDFKILLISMVLLLFCLVLIVAMRALRIDNNINILKSRREEFLKELFNDELLKALEREARTNHNDHIRIGCAHTLWSCRPDRAKAVLEDARTDWGEPVKNHANAILNRFY